MSAVSDLLDASREAHRAALIHRQKKRYAENDAKLREAYAKRLQALEADPTQADAGWSQDAPGQHERLMAFYAEKCV